MFDWVCCGRSGANTFIYKIYFEIVIHSNMLIFGLCTQWIPYGDLSSASVGPFRLSWASVSIHRRFWSTGALFRHIRLQVSSPLAHLCEIIYLCLWCHIFRQCRIFPLWRSKIHIFTILCISYFGVCRFIDPFMW